MRPRAIVTGLACIVIAIAFNGHAATPKAQIVATNTAGQALILSTATNTLILKDKGASAPFRAKLTCLELERIPKAFTSIVPGGPLVPISVTLVYGSAKADGKPYYFTINVAIGPRGDKVIQGVFGMGIRGTPSSSSNCGKMNRVFPSAGLAVFA